MRNLANCTILPHYQYDEIQHRHANGYEEVLHINDHFRLIRASLTLARPLEHAPFGGFGYIGLCFTFADADPRALAHPHLYHRTWGNTNSGYNIYLSRGYTLDNYRIDGASRQGMNGTQAINNSDSAIYESLSLVRGATGLASGTGEPGGVLELTRKRPTREARTSIEAGGGNWSHIRTVLDSSGALNRDGSLRGRGIAAYDHGGDWQHRAKQDRGTLYGILEYDLTPDTTLTLGLQHNQMRARGSVMIGYENYYGDPAHGYRFTPFGPRDNAGTRWSYNQSRSSEIFTRVNHRLNENWQLDAQYSYSFGKREQEYGVVGTFNIQPDGAARLTTGVSITHPLLARGGGKEPRTSTRDPEVIQHRLKFAIHQKATAIDDKTDVIITTEERRQLLHYCKKSAERTFVAAIKKKRRTVIDAPKTL